ncbi:uncharacterized protein alms1 [Corythoichthys intestinalis]|uniref:uncharacterized protein alms1 n=1 Tax=Corythoichthys intestinalis TaxID=161448 RepID=UPI0025A52AF1|nr:uncharacterized protein alms1 [Corythoichthys intestinalis]
MSFPFEASTTQVDEAGSSQHDPHKNGKMNNSHPHSQLGFQDNAMSPALSLLPANVAEYSLFQKSDTEFLPLTACPDFSAVHEHDEGSLSQHPLAQETVTTLTEADPVVEATSESYITSGSRDTRPDAASELLYRDLLSQSSKSYAELSSAARSKRDGTEESYLGFQPHSESTPGVMSVPVRSAVKSGTLSIIPSNNQSYHCQQVDQTNPSSDLSLVPDASSSVKLGSAVASSAPYWSSEPSAPPKKADLNIEERIPLYLQNLGIHRSPAEILTPFVPSGPIREPEFSPTDLSTIKDSAGGTPTKSVQSSQAGSPPKGDLSDGTVSSASGQDSCLLAVSLPGGTATSTSSTDGIDLDTPSLQSVIYKPRARSSLFPIRSEEPRESYASAKLAVVSEDPVSPRRAEPEGCSAAPRSPLTAGPSPALDDKESHISPDEASPPSDHAPSLEDSDRQSVMSDRSGRSSLTLRVEELLRGQTSPSGVSDPKNKKRFLRNLSEGQFDSLDLDKEDRRCIEEIKAAMLANNFVTSESSTDTESTAVSSVAASVMPNLSDPTHHVRETTSANVKAHTSITIAARKRPDASFPAPSEPPPLDTGCVRSICRNPDATKSPLEEERRAIATEAESEEPSQRCDVAEDTVIPFNHVSRTHLTLSPKPGPLGPSPSSSSSSSSGARAQLEPPTDAFVPLRRSSPPVSCADEGVGLSGPLPELDPHDPPTSTVGATGHHQHQSFTSNAMRSYTPETPVRDENNGHVAAPALRPYKPRGTDELFFMPDMEGRRPVSSSCTTMESSHTGLDDAVPPQFPPEVLGKCDAGLDRGVAIKHSKGIYSKKRTNAKASLYQGGAVASEETFPLASQSKASATAGFGVGGGATNTQVDHLPPKPADREAWLVEQLQRLENLILATRGNVQHNGTHYNETQARTHRSRQACALCPADRDESSTTTSTLDTDRLIRAFGAHRVQIGKSSKTPARLRKLYGEVAKQRERWEERSFRDAETSDQVTGESSAAGWYAQTPQRATSKMDGSRGKEVEIKRNVTRLHTRDVGTMFPPRSGRTQRSWVKGHLNSAKHKKTTGLPRLPKAVWWFVPLHDDNDFKENLPDLEEEAAEPEPSTVWYHGGTAAEKSTREALRPRQEHDNDDFVLPVYSKSSHQVISLQEALAARRADFISRSRSRMEMLSLRRINATVPGSVGPRRAVPWKEMIQRTKRMYERLPEVLYKMEAERREKQLQLNRLNLQIYNKRMSKRRLEKHHTVTHQYLG